ncbi:MAG: hypothetical protein NZL83_02405 [Candidatus Absconditabacterales bacterium]|nr:hypothetical protein [Candidatus Absconditabacterales bacterium]
MIDLISWLVVTGGSYTALKYIGIRLTPLSSMRTWRLTGLISVLFFSLPLPLRLPLLGGLHTLRDRISSMIWYSSICILFSLFLILCMHFLGGLVRIWEGGVAIRDTRIGMLVSSWGIWALLTSICVWAPWYPGSSIGLGLIVRRKKKWCQRLRNYRAQSHIIRLLLRLGGAWLMRLGGVDLIGWGSIRFDSLYLLVSHLFG